MKIAVTSASGQLGSVIVKQLKKEIGNDNGIGIARSPEKAAGRPHKTPGEMIEVFKNE